VKTAMEEANAVGAEAADVARSALEVIAEGVSEAGGNTSAAVNASIRSAMAAADDLGKLAREAVRQVLVGSAEGFAEIAKTRRAELAQASAAR